MNYIKKLTDTVIFIGDKLPPYDAYIKNISLLNVINRASITEAINNQEAYYIIQSSKADVICPILESVGLRYKENYIDELLVDKMLFKSKKLAVVYGNCQMHDYFDCLNMSEAFNKTYSSVYFKYQEYSRWREDRLESFLCLCDLFIYTHERFDARFRNCELFIKKNNGNARLIKIPTYSYRGYFPQTSPFIQEKGEFDIISEFFNSFHREDKIINKFIKEGYTCDEIVNKIMSKKIFCKDEILRCNDIALKQIEATDRVSDVKIFDFFASTYKNQRLFKDPVHMENVLTWHIMTKILELLNLPFFEEVPKKEIHYFTQLPIYPEVINVLNLNWSDNNQKIRIRLHEGMIQVGIEEFIRRYVRFAMNANEIRNSLTVSECDVVLESF